MVKAQSSYNLWRFPASGQVSLLLLKGIGFMNIMGFGMVNNSFFKASLTMLGD